MSFYSLSINSLTPQEDLKLFFGKDEHWKFFRLNLFKMNTQHIIVFFVLVRKMKIIEDTSTKYAIKLLVILLPMVIVPIASYDFLIFYFKHPTVIYSSMMVGFMIGVILVLVSEKIPGLVKQSISK